MLQIQIPGANTLILKHLLLDYNGTLAENGQLLPYVDGILTELATVLQVHVITADTFGTVEKMMSNKAIKIKRLSESIQDQEKLNYLNILGGENTIAIGNGRNDALMLKAAAVGIAVIQAEGAWVGTIQAADVICNSIVSALELLRNPSRLKATLRV